MAAFGDGQSHRSVKGMVWQTLRPKNESGANPRKRTAPRTHFYRITNMGTIEPQPGSICALRDFGTSLAHRFGKSEPLLSNCVSIAFRNEGPQAGSFQIPLRLHRQRHGPVQYRVRPRSY